MAQEVQTIVPGLLAKLPGLVVIGEPIVDPAFRWPIYGMQNPNILNISEDLLFFKDRKFYEPRMSHPDIDHYERREYAAAFSPGIDTLAGLQRTVEELEKKLAEERVLLNAFNYEVTPEVPVLNVYNFYLNTMRDESRISPRVYIARLVFNEYKGKEVVTLTRDLTLPEGQQHISASRTINNVLHSTVCIYPDTDVATRHLKTGLAWQRAGPLRPYESTFLPDTISAFYLREVTEKS